MTHVDFCWGLLLRNLLQQQKSVCKHAIMQLQQNAQHDWLSRVYCPTKHIIGHIGDGFYGSNDPTNSVKALKEVVVLRIRLQSHQVHLTMLQYYTVHMHAIYSLTQNSTCTKMNLSTVKWAQWDKTQSRELLGMFKCVQFIVYNCCTQYCTEQTW